MDQSPFGRTRSGCASVIFNLYESDTDRRLEARIVELAEILRLKLGVGLSHAIARSLGIAPSTVRLTLERAGAAGFSWPRPDDATDAILEEKLYGRAGTKQGHRRRAEPDWAVIHRELKKKHVTRSSS